MNKKHGLNLEKTYHSLSGKMYSIVEPKYIQQPELVVFNEALANELNIDATFLKSQEGLSFLTGSTNKYGPLLSQAYAGHQYGHFTMLGDGRAVLLGEQVTKSNKRYDLQLKGSGRTPYSRRGDGKATLYSMLREYIISEAMNALHIPTSRSLSVVRTNEVIQREKQESGAILTRIASSHIRVGTFGYANAYGNTELVKELADYSINRHYPHLNDKEKKYRYFLHEVIKNQATLIAKWQSVGFIHGVMNTDNMLISGETIDYGPCAFMDQYNPKTVFSSIDTQGRYAYQNQPYIASWNLSKFAESILLLLDKDPEKAVDIANLELKKFGEYFRKDWLELMALKLGIEHPTEEDKVLIEELLLIMQKYKADYTNVFRLMTQNAFDELSFYHTDEWAAWFIKWTRALGYRQYGVNRRMELMKQANPVIIPRNHLIEEALINASNENDYTLFNELLGKLINPFDYSIEHKSTFISDSKQDLEYKTFCGT